MGTLALLFLLEDGEETTSGYLVRLDDSDPVSQSSKLIDSGALLHQTEQVLVEFPAGERAARDLAALLRIATRINRLRRTHELVREILDSVFEVVPVDRGAILLTQGDKEFTSSLRQAPGRRRQRRSGVSRTVC